MSDQDRRSGMRSAMIFPEFMSTRWRPSSRTSEPPVVQPEDERDESARRAPGDRRGGEDMSADGHRQRMETAEKAAAEKLRLAVYFVGPPHKARLLREAAGELDRAEQERVALERVERAKAKTCDVCGRMEACHGCRMVFGVGRAEAKT